jgi:hypothetical protein
MVTAMGAAAAVLHVIDETPDGKPLRRAELRLASESLSVRELIAGRVRREVEAFNASADTTFYGLVQPTGTERALNGYRLAKRRRLDADEQIAAACEAFERGAFLLLVGDEQLESLDDRFVVQPGLEAHFVQLVPLVGG